MSGFVCVLDRTGAGLEPREIRRLAEPLTPYGDRLSVLCHGPAAIAVQHPADHPARCHGPLTDPASGVMVAMVGRLVDEEEANDPAWPDAPVWASLARDALVDQQAGALARTTGSFALIAADPQRCRMTITRDHLGTRSVYYHLGRRWLIAASEPAVVLLHGAVSDDLDERSAARFLGFRFHQTERTFFRQIQQLPPAHQLCVTSGDCRRRQYWRFRLLDSDQGRSPDGITARFLSLLRRSLAAQLHELPADRTGLSLSSGLDSTTLAALAPRGVRAFSFYFKDLPDCDERRGIEAVAEHLNLPIRWLRADGLYPLCGDWFDRFAHRGSPNQNAFAALKCELYRLARADGCQRIIVGDAGDALYSASEYWLRDSLGAARKGALAGLFATVRRTLQGDPLARRALRRLLPIPGIRSLVRRHSLPWLTELAHSQLPAPAFSPILPEGRQKRRYELSVGAKHTELESEEVRLFDHCGIGRANPFWHWPLLEMVINLPAWWYQEAGRTKVLAREAMRGLLPRSVLESHRVGLLGSFFLRGIEARRRELVETVLTHPRSDWQRYVKPAWLEPFLAPGPSIRFGHTILWRVISYELWYRRLIGAQWVSSP